MSQHDEQVRQPQATSVYHTHAARAIANGTEATKRGGSHGMGGGRVGGSMVRYASRATQPDSQLVTHPRSEYVTSVTCLSASIRISLAFTTWASSSKMTIPFTFFSACRCARLSCHGHKCAGVQQRIPQAHVHVQQDNLPIVNHSLCRMQPYTLLLEVNKNNPEFVGRQIFMDHFRGRVHMCVLQG